MTTYNARLLTLPRMREIAEIADSISDACNVLGDSLAEYENVSELPVDERQDAREEARDEAWEKIGEILADAKKLSELRDRLSA